MTHSNMPDTSWWLWIQQQYPRSWGFLAGEKKWTKANATSNKSMIGHQWCIGGFLALIEQQWHCLPLVSRLVKGKLNPSHSPVSPNGEVRPMGVLEAVLAVVFAIVSHIRRSPDPFV